MEPLIFACVHNAGRSQMANGLTSADIGIKLGISERTVTFHFANIISKLGVLNRKEAIATGVANGIIRLTTPR